MGGLGSDASIADVIGSALAKSVARLAEHEDGVRKGGDPEDVHQARVAARRLRSDLRTFRDFVEPTWTADLRAELRWLGSELGLVRDVEVMIDRLRDHATHLPDSEHDVIDRTVRRLVADHATARTEMLAALGSPRYLTLRTNLDDAVRNPCFTDAATAPALEELPRVVQRPWKQLRREVRRLGTVPANEELHQVRIRAKRCRYAAEAAEPVFGKRASRFAAGIEQIQEILGEHQDAVVASSWLAKTAAESSPTDAYAIGMLAQVECDIAFEVRGEFPKLWKKASRRKLRSWLTQS